MDKTINYITEEKKNALQKELAELKGPRRKEILESLEYAKSLGDLSENAEYHQAREDQVKLEERILKVEQMLRSGVVALRANGEHIEIGSKIIVQKEDTKEEKEYEIVGAEEADMALGKLSNKSPLGGALFGKKKGDVVSFTTPRGGEVSYKILKVS